MNSGLMASAEKFSMKGQRDFMKPLLTIFLVFVALLTVLAPWPACASYGPPAGERPDGAVSTKSAHPGFLLAARETVEQEPPDEDMSFWEDEEEEEMLKVADPLYHFNKAMYHFNDKLYFWVVKPAARGYNRITPGFVRRGVRNFFFNIRFPIRFVNCVLQGKGNDVGMEFGRFLVNTTVGVLGFRNAAKDYPELNPPEEDTGQTLGRWGVGNGFYIVWPFLGPSTLRDSVGLVGDYFLNPVTYVEPRELSFGLKVYEAFNDISFKIGDYESLTEGAIDPYLSIRDAYIQHRHKVVQE